MQILFRILYYFTAISYLIGCQSPATVESEIKPNPGTSEVYQPALALGDLFHAVQMSGIFADSKTFVDCRPRVPSMEIRSAYDQQNKDGSVDLKGLVEQYFEIPLAMDKPIFKSRKNMIDHLNSLWPSLTRNPDDRNGASSLLPLPYPYVVPGGRFREIYYWDSYFTMLGLLESQQDSIVLNMIRNFGYLIDTYGFIPNGNRSYYLGRSQPPFFSSMVMLWASRHGLDAALQFLDQMHGEYDFWMQGKELLLENNSSNGRLVRLPDGTILNRYWDSFTQPRPESYKEDYELGETFPENQRERVYRDLRAGAESGWDYSSRWFSDGESLDSIITTKIIPVDLNCLLYFLECSIAKLSLHAGDTSMVNFF